MRATKDIRSDLLIALGAAGDAVFAKMGFSRRASSFDYIRINGETRQTIAFSADYLPRYAPGVELHLHPSMILKMDSVSETALRLVAGNEVLLANAPDIILNQPIEFAAPKAEHVRWLASGLIQMKERVSDIGAFVEGWVYQFLEVLAVPDGLIGIYEASDVRMMRQRHWYIYVAAAYLNRGEKSRALAVLENNLGALGLRRYYSVVFDAANRF